MELRVVFNSKLACHGEQGLMNAIRRMNEVNSMKVAARVDYLNTDRTISKRVKPCYVVVNSYFGSTTIFVYGSNKLANTIYFTLHQITHNPGHYLYNANYDVKHVKNVEEGETDMYYRCTIY